MRLRMFWILCLLYCLCNQTKAQVNLLEWRADRPLAWDDFLGRPKGSAFALTVPETTPRIFKTQDGLICMTGVVFNRLKSFKQDTVLNNPYWKKFGLQHEQIHFDIAMLHALKLDSIVNSGLLNTSNQSGFVQKCDSVFDAVFLESEKMQAEYEKETVAALNHQVQQIWNTRVRKRIESLLDFNRKYYRVLQE